MKDNYFTLVFIAIIVTLAGELKFYPFQGSFRIGLGIPIFFLFLLWTHKIPAILAGFLVGILVVAFRITLDSYFNGSFHFSYELVLHFSSLFYYVTYSFLFYLAKINKIHHRPLLIGFFAVLIEMTASMMELIVRHLILGNTINFTMISEIIIISFIRSFFTLSFFYIIMLNRAKHLAEKQLKQNSHMILLISNLYEESIQLKKSLQNAEDITRDCYTLYQNLLNTDTILNVKELSEKLLGITGQVHEIKKDNQRIYAGLSKMIADGNSTDYMTIDEISSIILETNKKYSYSLHKNIEFNSVINDVYPPMHVYTVLSIINNLVSNSVEAIKIDGSIKLSICKTRQLIEFIVTDDAGGIPKNKKELIFKPGYTTKYDNSGKPSTGMGLPYVKDVVNNLKGTIVAQDNSEALGTVFVIQLPISNLIQRG
ncbi:sensor histidine kinase [Clostridium tagluense]|uniref:ATP-binding protein n=1 Tax=Clostridium tagluense TaxID=360422 RepID=UPI001CF450C6|nr:sensor histidine kinase [Clostridium tagluense]MCB2311438.1 sensor histidine kinase [Clostridium tagluense]MCB2316162.1 sensor histidine kinase [Clostridium tagluense]MCB2321034.1 sensor histidine kinase [Clostridium tagluense]MCB2326051.1 sensor histidine kinase [Clostridium tagluense]MCB2330774.1 sensor histidine kinase [Clostridium tagluense]